MCVERREEGKGHVVSEILMEEGPRRWLGWAGLGDLLLICEDLKLGHKVVQAFLWQVPISFSLDKM